jgi:hypothetical protein
LRWGIVPGFRSEIILRSGPVHDLAEELVDVRDIGGRFHDVVDGRAGGGECGGDILADLPELRAHVALAHHVAVGVPGELARDKDHPLPFDHDDVGIQDTAVHDPLGQRLRLDVLSVHRTPPSRSLLRSPEATAPLS